MRINIKDLKSNPVTKPFLTEAGLIGDQFLEMSKIELTSFWEKSEQCRRSFPSIGAFLNFWRIIKENNIKNI